jgi:hypothetical protein
MLGCGSSATTSPAEAHAITVAERTFLAKWRHAEGAATARCSAKGGQAEKCHTALAVPPQGKAIREFSESIEALLDEGVGPECAEALESTLSTMDVTAFPGEATAICRAESQQ